MDIGKKIKLLRSEFGLTQDELADASKVSKSFISYIERGERNPTLDILEQLADGFGISLISLLGFDEFIPQNIKLIMRDLSIPQFIEDIKNKTDMDDIFDDEDIQNYLSGETIPSESTLQLIAEYAGVSLDFFYRANTIESFEKERLSYTDKLKKQNQEDILNNKGFKRIFEKIRDNNLDLKAIENIIDIMIQQTKK